MRPTIDTNCGRRRNRCTWVRSIATIVENYRHSSKPSIRVFRAPAPYVRPGDSGVSGAATIGICTRIQMIDLDLSIVIPAFKEADKIPADIRAASDFLRKHHLRGEIILVDDGSGDDTKEVACSLQPDFPELTVLTYHRNRGKGHAIAQGVRASRGHYVLFADAGLCVPYEISRIGITMLQLNMCDIAHGSRRMRGSVRKAQPLYRRLGSAVYGVAIHTLMGIPGYISDTQCGFKIYRQEVARKLFGEMATAGFMFDIDIIRLALRDEFRILEFPVLWSNDADTRYDPIRGTLQNLRELAKIRLRKTGEGSCGERLVLEDAIIFTPTVPVDLVAIHAS
jgi:dolichyl-phosphate beta-glucosyltransferase